MMISIINIQLIIDNMVNRPDDGPNYLYCFIIMENMLILYIQGLNLLL